MDIFIHRRDIRWQDNTTLLKMENVVPIFIFTPEQIYPEKNKYFSNDLVEFLCTSLSELSNQYKKMDSKLLIFEDDIIKTLNRIKKNIDIKRIGFNLDYSPYSKKRDDEIKNWAKNNNIECITNEDMLLVNLLDGKTKKDIDDDPYKVFTPFMRHCKQYDVLKVNKKKPKFATNFFNKLTKDDLKKLKCLNSDEITKFYKENPNRNVIGGREEGLKKLKDLKLQKDYDKCRNFLDYKTSHLSAYINLGILSIREIYHHAVKTLGNNNGFITELYWRDFYYNVLYFYPHVVGGSFREEYNKLKWNNDKKLFNKWCKGETGFPIVDACMKQLNKIGYMHNRGRMIVASFLTKDLLIDWKWGEKYFANKLIDYNISANNGGWQWAAGTGTDAQPYFRIFNPWSQSIKFDKDASFIKLYIPELKEIPAKDIHNWNKSFEKYPNINYPKPIIDHAKARKDALDMYKKLK